MIFLQDYKIKKALILVFIFFGVTNIHQVSSSRYCCNHYKLLCKGDVEMYGRYERSNT